MKIKAASQCLNGTSGKGSQYPGGFTLIELLVVMAIMAILAAMLLPALAMSKDRGQGARCLGNLRQLTTAWLAYTSDNRGYLVSNGGIGQQPSSLTDPSYPEWCPGLQEIWQDLSALGSPHNVGGQWIRKGLLYPYVGNEGVYKCPADTSTLLANGLQFPHVRTVSMNCYLGPITPWDNATVQAACYYTDASMVRPGPAHLFVFIDENPLSINDAFFICQPTSTRWIDCPASYHNGGSGMSFADGHAQIKRWTDQTVLGFTGPPNLGSGQDPGIPQQNPPTDLNWLESVSSYLKQH